MRFQLPHNGWSYNELLIDDLFEPIKINFDLNQSIGENKVSH
uniref:Uncharacterized protein n=1 Tax=Anguilla anguilla TaxID=7936 RepID=A0A0E9RFN0_ANGAN